MQTYSPNKRLNCHAQEQSKTKPRRQREQIAGCQRRTRTNLDPEVRKRDGNNRIGRRGEAGDVPAEGDLELAEVEGVAAVDAKVGLERALDEVALVHRGAPPEVLHGHGRRRRELGFFDEDDEVAFGRFFLGYFPFSFWGPSRPGLPWSVEACGLRKGLG